MVQATARRLSGHPSGHPGRYRRDHVLRLGIDPATEVKDTLGRPLPIAAGKPITSLFS